MAPRPCRGRGPLRIAYATPIVTLFQLLSKNSLHRTKPSVANAQSFRRGTVAQTFGGIRGAPAGQSYRTGPYRLTRLTPGYGRLPAVTPAETPRPLGTRRPPGLLACDYRCLSCNIRMGHGRCVANVFKRVFIF